MPSVSYSFVGKRLLGFDEIRDLSAFGAHVVCKRNNIIFLDRKQKECPAAFAVIKRAWGLGRLGGFFHTIQF